MEDSEIIKLYWSRNQLAIPETAQKYGGYCSAIAGNILGSREDAEECVNDVYLTAWNTMPPQKPGILSAFLGKITRNLSLNRWRQNHAQKRGGGEIALVLEELAECVSGTENVEQEADRQELAEAINSFLELLPAEKRRMFLLRYWYAEPVNIIANRLDVSENHVSVTLHRLRRKLWDYLTERGFVL